MCGVSCELPTAWPTVLDNIHHTYNMTGENHSSVDISSQISEDIQIVDTSWGDDELPSVRIIEAVSEVIKADPIDMEPLQQFVDADALNSILKKASKNGNTDVEVSFDYDGMTVSIMSNGFISVYE